MGKYKSLINQIDKQSKDDVKISEYFHLLGYNKKWNFERFLKNGEYELMTKSELIKNRMGKEVYMHAGDLLRLLNEHLINDEDWETDYRHYLYMQFKQTVYKFRDTPNNTRREKLGNFISAKGTFYNYSLSTISFAKQVNLCPYLCYKIVNTNYQFRDIGKAIDYTTKEPNACFDSRNWHTRSLFIQFIDLATKILAKTDAQLIVIDAYRMAIKEMLDHQLEIDSKTTEEDKKLDEKNAVELKQCYREACKLFHPDTNKTPEAEEIMKQINNFYEDKNLHGIKNVLSKTKKSV